jgi:hypothetical protein
MIVLLLRPVVVVSSVVPRSTNVAVVLDDSLSMKLKDTPGGATRLDGVRQALFSAPAGQRTFMNLLDERFKTELYGFSGSLSKLKSENDHTVRAQQRCCRSFERSTKARRTPLSAVVLATDGAAVCRQILQRSCASYGRDVACFTIGVGDTVRPTDAELAKLICPAV